MTNCGLGIAELAPSKLVLDGFVIEPTAVVFADDSTIVLRDGTVVSSHLKGFAPLVAALGEHFKPVASFSLVEKLIAAIHSEMDGWPDQVTKELPASQRRIARAVLTNRVGVLRATIDVARFSQALQTLKPAVAEAIRNKLRSVKASKNRSPKLRKNKR